MKMRRLVINSTFFTFPPLGKVLIPALFLLVGIQSSAQTITPEEAKYRNTVTERAAKIVKTLEIRDSLTYNFAVATLVDRYVEINSIHDESKKAVDIVKQSNVDGEAAIKKEEESKISRLSQTHELFLAKLNTKLNKGQIEKVKDGLTYGVLPLTYAAYQDMLPDLTKTHKEKIYSWLLEARELAMDAESSDKKHAVFGKYKGRINNYLSAAGYDLKKEGDAWQERIRESKEKKKAG